jgi:hypothetical protein
MKLWVDDFRPAPPGWTTAKNAEQALVALLTGDVEEMSLDHDLDDPDCENCQFACGHVEGRPCQSDCRCHIENGSVNGLSLLKWMNSLGMWPRKKPMVHSANREQAPVMVQFIEHHFPHGP